MAEPTTKTLDEALADFYRQMVEANSPETVAPGNRPWSRPLVSQALAVHAKQAEAANERARRHGINVHYDAKGDCHIPDRNERKKLLRLERMHDNNGGYGD